MTTYAELQAQIKKLQEQAEQVKAKELETVVADIKKKISEYGLTAEQGFKASSDFIRHISDINGKKIGMKDAFRALYCIIKYNIFKK